MRDSHALLLGAASLAALASACSRRLASPDALQATADADTLSDAAGESSTDQVEGPARTEFTSWTSCGWSSSEACLCDGIRACEAGAGGAFSALGSRQARVCAIDGDACEYVVFVETEGGGTARRCRVPLGTASCVAGFGGAPDSDCVDLFTCNLLMGTCPPDVTPGGTVISCR